MFHMSFTEMNLLKQMQLSWLLKHNQVRDCQIDIWTILKLLVMHTFGKLYYYFFLKIIISLTNQIQSPHCKMLFILFIFLEQTEGEDVEIGCPITCGDSKALLLVKKFVCPGINVKCVKVCILVLVLFQRTLMPERQQKSWLQRRTVSKRGEIKFSIQTWIMCGFQYICPKGFSLQESF